MQIKKNHINVRDHSGSATLYPEEPEDMWHAYNLIRPSDILRASAIRRVTTTQTATGASSSQRVHVNLTIRVTSTDFDPAAGQLHVSGRVAEENKHVALGSYHTLDLELHRNFTLEKADGWDSVAIGILRDAARTDARAQIWAVVMQEGLANICQITEHQTVFRQSVRVAIPHKRSGAGDHEKAMVKFHKTLLDTLLRQVDLPTSATAAAASTAPTTSSTSSSSTSSQPPPLLIASPGFYAQNFQRYIKDEAQRTTNKPLLAYLPSIITAHSASGHLSALSEALSSPELKSRLSDTKYARETALMDRFYSLMRKDDARAWYGPREVEAAVDRGGVGRGGGVLLISDALFRSLDVKVRRRWVGLVDKVRDVEGGEVRVLSSAHESGKRLEALGGVAAILTFPMPDLDELEDDVDENLPDVLEDGQGRAGEQDNEMREVQDAVDGLGL